MSEPQITGRTRPSRVRLNWAAITTVIVAFVVGIVIGMGIQFQIDHAAPAQSLPPCVDLVADNGGMCEGPLIDLPACETEDSDNCVWDAVARGNGLGTSFVAYDGEVYYVGQ